MQSKGGMLLLSRGLAADCSPLPRRSCPNYRSPAHRRGGFFAPCSHPHHPCATKNCSNRCEKQRNVTVTTPFGIPSWYCTPNSEPIMTFLFYVQSPFWLRSFLCRYAMCFCVYTVFVWCQTPHPHTHHNKRIGRELRRRDPRDTSQKNPLEMSDAALMRCCVRRHLAASVWRTNQRRALFCCPMIHRNYFVPGQYTLGSSSLVPAAYLSE